MPVDRPASPSQSHTSGLRYRLLLRLAAVHPLAMNPPSSGMSTLCTSKVDWCIFFVFVSSQWPSLTKICREVLGGRSLSVFIFWLDFPLLYMRIPFPQGQPHITSEGHGTGRFFILIHDEPHYPSEIAGGSAATAK